MTHAEGLYGKALPWGVRLIPRRDVDAHDGRLWWRRVKNWQRDARFTSDTQGALDGFIELGHASDRDIESFARRFGVLLLCQAHELHVCHPQSLGEAPCAPKEREGICSEPLATWREMAARARAILTICAAIRARSTIASKDFEAAFGAGTVSFGGWGGMADPRNNWEVRLTKTGEVQPAPELWPALALEVNNWLFGSCARPRCLWDGKALSVRLGEGPSHFAEDGLFSILAMQLAFAVTQAERMLVCDGCGGPNFTRRLPDSGKRNYCPACRRAKVPQRDAARDWRREHLGRQVPKRDN